MLTDPACSEGKEFACASFQSLTIAGQCCCGLLVARSASATADNLRVGGSQYISISAYAGRNVMATSKCHVAVSR